MKPPAYYLNLSSIFPVLPPLAIPSLPVLNQYHVVVAVGGGGSRYTNAATVSLFTFISLPVSFTSLKTVLKSTLQIRDFAL